MKTYFAIAAITSLLIFAITQGINGTLLASGIAIIATLAGVAIGKHLPRS